MNTAPWCFKCEYAHKDPCESGPSDGAVERTPWCGDVNNTAKDYPVICTRRVGHEGGHWNHFHGLSWASRKVVSEVEVERAPEGQRERISQLAHDLDTELDTENERLREALDRIQLRAAGALQLIRAGHAPPTLLRPLEDVERIARESLGTRELDNEK